MIVPRRHVLEQRAYVFFVAVQNIVTIRSGSLLAYSTFFLGLARLTFKPPGKKFFFDDRAENVRRALFVS